MTSVTTCNSLPDCCCSWKGLNTLQPFIYFFMYHNVFSKRIMHFKYLGYSVSILLQPLSTLYYFSIVYIFRWKFWVFLTWYIHINNFVFETLTHVGLGISPLSLIHQRFYHPWKLSTLPQQRIETPSISLHHMPLFQCPSQPYGILIRLFPNKCSPMHEEPNAHLFVNKFVLVIRFSQPVHLYFMICLKIKDRDCAFQKRIWERGYNHHYGFYTTCRGNYKNSKSWLEVIPHRFLKELSLIVQAFFMTLLSQRVEKSNVIEKMLSHFNVAKSVSWPQTFLLPLQLSSSILYLFAQEQHWRIHEMVNSWTKVSCIVSK